MPLTALFRCDASPKIGGGHATRSLALADALAGAGWRIVFAVRPESVETAPAIARHEIVTLRGDPADEPAEIRAALAGAADWLVVDHNGRDVAFEAACRPWARRILVITDFANRRHDCDLLLDQMLGREAGAESGLHKPLVPPHCRQLLGMNYALVREQFARRRAEAEERRGRGGAARRVLLSFGATDPFGLTSRALKALLARAPSFAIDVVTGLAPGAALEAIADAQGGRVTLRHAVDDMAALMLAADLAVGLAGTSGSERCALGLPTALFVPSEHYDDISDRFAAAGACEIVAHETFDDDATAAAIMALAADPSRLARMSAAAFAICDGRGANRAAGTMRAMTEAGHRGADGID